MTKKEKSKPMSRKLKSFLKKYGRFPKGNELKNYQKRSSSSNKKKGAKKKHKHHKSQSKTSSPCRKRGWHVFG